MAEAHRDRTTEQRAEIDGANNIVVQIEGDRNAVNLKGLAHLTLTRYLTRRQIESDADLLSPYTRSIPLIGREGELAELRAWLASEKPISVRVLTGRAGAGKTRLALELCETMLQESWDAGFVESGELERFRSQQNLGTWGWQRPTLIVIDYTAIRAERLSGWLKELSDNPGKPDRPLRLLLLERHAETGSGWWQAAFGRGGFGARAVQKLLDPPEPLPIAPITDAGVRREVLRQVLSEKGAEARPPPAGVDPGFDQELEKVDWGGEPLFLMMAGVMAADRSMGQVLSLGRTDLAFELAERELKRVAEIGQASGIDPDFLPVMAGYVTLCRGVDEPLLLSAVEAQKAALGLPGAGDPGKVAKVLCEALPGPDGEAGPILPDMIGEAATLCAFEAYDDNGAQAVQCAFAQAGQRTAASVIRTAQDFSGASELELPDERLRRLCKLPLDWLDVLIERDKADLKQLMLLANALPRTSLALAERQANVHDIIVIRLEQEVDSGEENSLPLLATALDRATNARREVGRREEALAAAKQAVGIRRTLAARHPDAYEPALAMSLNSLAISLSEVGRGAKALALAEQALKIRRRLAARDADAYAPALAMSYRTVASCLSAVGRGEEALAPAEQAVKLYHKLAERNPNAYEPALAMSLSNLATFLSEVGRRSEALAPAKQAVEIWRKLAVQAPDAYRPDRAFSLSVLADRLEETGHLEEASAADEDVVRTVAPVFLGHPQACADRMNAILRNYLRRGQAHGREPNAELLGPILEVLERLREPPPDQADRG